MLRAGLAALCVVSICAPAHGQSGATIHMRDSTFNPQTIRVHVGDTVVFSNDDEVPHNVTGSALNSGDIDGGKSWTYTFTKPGAYNFVCTYHSWMKGTVTALASGQ
jgi:plastocyanin